MGIWYEKKRTFGFSLPEVERKRVEEKTNIYILIMRPTSSTNLGNWSPRACVASKVLVVMQEQDRLPETTIVLLFSTAKFLQIARILHRQYQSTSIKHWTHHGRFLH